MSFYGTKMVKLVSRHAVSFPIIYGCMILISCWHFRSELVLFKIIGFVGVQYDLTSPSS